MKIKNKTIKYTIQIVTLVFGIATFITLMVVADHLTK